MSEKFIAARLFVIFLAYGQVIIFIHSICVSRFDLQKLT